MDIKRETSSNKKNWLIELSELTEHERDNFLEFICDDKDGKKLNKAMGLEFAVVSIFYRRDRNQRLNMNMNMRVSKCFNIHVMIHNTNLKKRSWFCCLLQAYLQFQDRITWTTFTKLIKDQGLLTDKLSRVKLAFSHTDEMLNQNVEVMANYVASGDQWHESYGMMHYRGNVSKNKGPQRKKIPLHPRVRVSLKRRKWKRIKVTHTYTMNLVRGL
jgi:hypothetical protein